MASYADLSRPPLAPIGKEEKKEGAGGSINIFFPTENVVEQTQCKQSVPSSMMETRAVKDCTFVSFVDCISKECCTLCERKDSSVSLFRSIPVTAIANNKWEEFIEELQSKAPLLLQVFTTVVSAHDHRNTNKVGPVHYPGICAAIAVLLKERSREMCGLHQ